ncbi:MAG: CoA transferase [Myxococcota bacterium]
MPPALPLDDVHILDFTMNVPGPQATAVLQRMGARITKVEPPRGDNARLMPRLFTRLNRGKSSVRLDLRTPEGWKVAMDLAATADVVLESFRPGVMDRLGLGQQQLRARHPRLVYCSISGFGQEGPLRSVPAHDLNLQALSGLAHMLRGRDGQPRTTALPLADLSASATVVHEILAALRQRDHTGRGSFIDVALVDAIASWVQLWSDGIRPDEVQLGCAVQPLADRLDGTPLRRVGRWVRSSRGQQVLDRLGTRLAATRWFAELERQRLHALPHYGLFKTLDGRHISVGIVDEQKFWAELCTRLGFASLGTLPLVARVTLAKPLRVWLRRTFAARTLDAWMAVLGDSLPVAPVLTEAEAGQHPQLRARPIPTAAPAHVSPSRI